MNDEMPPLPPGYEYLSLTLAIGPETDPDEAGRLAAEAVRMKMREKWGRVEAFVRES